MLDLNIRLLRRWLRVMQNSLNYYRYWNTKFVKCLFMECFCQITIYKHMSKTFHALLLSHESWPESTLTSGFVSSVLSRWEWFPAAFQHVLDFEPDPWLGLMWIKLSECCLAMIYIQPGTAWHCSHRGYLQHLPEQPLHPVTNAQSISNRLVCSSNSSPCDQKVINDLNVTTFDLLIMSVFFFFFG